MMCVSKVKKSLAPGVALPVAEATIDSFVPISRCTYMTFIVAKGDKYLTRRDLGWD